MEGRKRARALTRARLCHSHARFRLDASFFADVWEFTRSTAAMPLPTAEARPFLTPTPTVTL